MICWAALAVNFLMPANWLFIGCPLPKEVQVEISRMGDINSDTMVQVLWGILAQGKMRELSGQFCYVAVTILTTSEKIGILEFTVFSLCCFAKAKAKENL